MSCGCKSKTKQTYTKCGNPIAPNPVIKYIYDDCTDSPLFPITSTDAVIDADNKNLTTILAELEECRDNLVAEVEQIVSNAKEDFEHIFEARLLDKYNLLKSLIDQVNTRITDLHSGGSSGGGSIDPSVYTRLIALETDLLNTKNKLNALEAKFKSIDHFLPTEVIPGNGLVGDWTTKTIKLSLAPNLIHVVNSIPSNASAGLYLTKTGMTTYYRGDLLNLGAKWNVSDVAALVSYILGNNLATAELVQLAVAAAYAAIEDDPEVPEDVVDVAEKIKEIVKDFSNVQKIEPLFPYNNTIAPPEDMSAASDPWGDINGGNNADEEVENVEAETEPSEGEATDPTDDTSGSLITYAELYKLKCDVNKDGNVNTSDITALINIILGLAPKPLAETVALGEVLIKVYSDGSLELVAPQPGLIYIDIDNHRLLAFYNGVWNVLYADLIDEAVGA